VRNEDDPLYPHEGGDAMTARGTIVTNANMCDECWVTEGSIGSLHASLEAKQPPYSQHNE
jgi:hypothetical protein